MMFNHHIQCHNIYICGSQHIFCFYMVVKVLLLMNIQNIPYWKHDFQGISMPKVFQNNVGGKPWTKQEEL